MMLCIIGRLNWTKGWEYRKHHNMIDRLHLIRVWSPKRALFSAHEGHSNPKQPNILQINCCDDKLIKTCCIENLSAWSCLSHFALTIATVMFCCFARWKAKRHPEQRPTQHDNNNNCHNGHFVDFIVYSCCHLHCTIRTLHVTGESAQSLHISTAIFRDWRCPISSCGSCSGVFSGSLG